MLAVAALAGMACFATTAYAKPSGNWRIAFNHVADNDGAIVFRIAPVEGTPIDVETKVPAKTTENNVADLVSDSLKAKLGIGKLSRRRRRRRRRGHQEARQDQEIRIDDGEQFADRPRDQHRTPLGDQKGCRRDSGSVPLPFIRARQALLVEIQAHVLEHVVVNLGLADRAPDEARNSRPRSPRSGGR